MTLIQTKQHWLPRLLNITATLLAWGIFAYLMIDGVNTLLYGGPQPKELPLQGKFFATIHSLLWYLLLAVALSATLLAWAKYNQRRAARYSRRQRAPDICDTRLATSFGISEESLIMMRREQILVLFNDASGKLSKASFVRQGHQKLDVKAPVASPKEEKRWAA